ncbi:magnesium transporter [Ornithinibacillus bavariensis]|uniref:Magnesium transporter MgtE n=1 Tax=Ornithinibacillus bavariensis TaxID=545502 RepID=A0A919X7A5_9BACI|nr:magnesium transporter [Ornithinibacillus bavariensis]GIO25777.1 magnesium transporter [Ornithinibacillus bavariensis]HAM79817.1 magnesium transporter [Ornithinibacillus sp.]
MENMEELKVENIVKIKQFLTDENLEGFREYFLDLHPYDQAKFFMEVEATHRMRIYSYLSPEEVAGIMEHIELEDAQIFFSEMDPRFASMIFAEMATDDAVDILNEMEKDKVVSFLTIMDVEEADEIKDLLHYEEKTAGSIMTTEYISVYKTQTVKDTMAQLKKDGPDAETIYYLYVIDDDKKLVGVLSLRDLIISDDETNIESIMNENVFNVSVAENQEDVAKMMRDYDFLAVPVVDFQRHLIGIITVDDILDVIDEEASEDYSKLAGISDVDRPDTNPFIAAKKRLPWLIILLFLGMLTASLIGQFEETLSKVTILSIFIPLIGGMAGNTGTQALAVAVRGLATGEYEEDGKLKLILREAGTGLITGTVCGIIIAIVIFLWQHNLYLGLLVGLSIMTTLVIATLAGSLIPLVMYRMKIDPAVASGPFITTINDIISVLIYFGLATTFMNLLL